MKIRFLEPSELLEYQRWYLFFHKRNFPKSFYSESVLCAEENGVLGAAIMYQPVQKAPFCLFTYLTRNPYCDRNLSSRAVDFLIQNLGSVARENGFTHFASLIGEESAKNRFRKNGIQDDVDLTLFWRAV